MLKSIGEIVREAEFNYLQGTTTIGEYVDFQMHDTIERIDAYLNSKHINGDTDSLGREKPFFNIVSAAVNIWYRATDIDRKNIRIKPSQLDQTLPAFIATVHLQEWMKRERFGVFLNQWGRALARYGSAVVKFAEQDGRLIPTVIPWNRYIADPVQFDAIPNIEKFYMTPAQLRKNPNYDQKVVDELLEGKLSTRKTLDKSIKDTKDDFIELYEVHGELDERLLDEEPDQEVEDKDIKYRQQMHVVAYLQDGKEYKDFCLYKGKEKKSPYMLTHLIEEDGRTLSIGAVEYLFDAQWMTNHSIKNMKDTLDLASRLIFQTADNRFIGRNVLSAIETGDIFVHAENKPLTRLANDKPDITAIQNFGMMWQNMAKELTATPDAMRGDTPPSGTPYSTTALVTQQSNSLFEIMTENKGFHLEDMMREFVIPHLLTKMDTKEEVMATLEADQIAEIDAMYVPAQAVRNYNARFIDQLEKSINSDQEPLPQQFNQQAEEQSVRDGMASQGNKRSFKPDELDTKTWRESIGKFPWTSEVEVTNENTDKAAVLTTLSSTFQTLASVAASGRPLTSDMRLVLGTILSETGKISPLQLSTSASSPQSAPSAPVQAPALDQLAKVA